MEPSSAKRGASGAARVRTGNRSTEPRVGSSNLSGRAAPGSNSSDLTEAFDASLARLVGWRRRQIALARRIEAGFLAVQRRAARRAVAS